MVAYLVDQMVALLVALLVASLGQKMAVSTVARTGSWMVV